MTTKDPGLFVFVESENNGVQITTPSNPQLTVGQRTDEVLNPSALYEYSLGIKDIQARYISYGERQAYVSKVLDIPGNVMEIELDANEDHPVFDEVNGQASARQTSVEYYISYKAKPNLEDWIPLLQKVKSRYWASVCFSLMEKQPCASLPNSTQPASLFMQMG